MSKNNLIKKPISQLVDVYNNIRVPLSSNQRENLEKYIHIIELNE